MKLPILIAVLAAAIVGTLIAITHGAEQPAPAAAPKLTVGVFDSRAVVIAYAHSELFQKSTKEAKERHQAAKAAGDEETTSAIEAEMRAKQKEFHLQCFAATPIDNILELIKDEIPAIAKQAGVDLIVSKWQIVHQTEGAEVVDVTMAMIAPFKPGERALSSIKDMEGKAPLSVEELESHDD